MRKAVRMPSHMTVDDAKTVQAAGRTVGYYELGEPSGAPVLLLHGTPACGAGFAWADSAGRELGLRLLAPDRAGIGRSAPLPGRTLDGYPGEIGAFADALGLDRFAVLGYSGGGPYAVACAALLGDRVTVVGVGAGMGDPALGSEGFSSTDERMLRWSVHHPRLAKLFLGLAAFGARRSPASAVKSFKNDISPTDREVLAGLGPPAAQIALFTEAFTQGAGGPVQDYAVISVPWDFDLAAVTTPVHIWHGTDDPMVPLSHSESLASLVPTAQLHLLPGEGHLAIVAHIEAILRTLKESMT